MKIQVMQADASTSKEWRINMFLKIGKEMAIGGIIRYTENNIQNLRAIIKIKIKLPQAVSRTEKILL